MNDAQTILFYDTETTGIPDWSIPSESPSQPHIVQLAAVLCCAKSRKIIQTLDVIIRADDWEIPQETVEIHGITTDYSKRVGVNEALAVELLMEMARGATRVAYNKTFDQRIIRIAAKRYSTEEKIEAWAVKEDHDCAMRMAQSAMGGKNPKLKDAYLHFTGKTLENAHSAMADTLAAMEVYWSVKDINSAKEGV